MTLSAHVLCKHGILKFDSELLVLSVSIDYDSQHGDLPRTLGCGNSDISPSLTFGHVCKHFCRLLASCCYLLARQAIGKMPENVILSVPQFLEGNVTWGTARISTRHDQWSSTSRNQDK
eukprot:2542859-Amphidinium_carterae.1